MNSRRETSIRISFSWWQSDLKLPFPFHVVKSVFPAVFQILVEYEGVLGEDFALSLKKKYLVFNVERLHANFAIIFEIAK